MFILNIPNTTKCPACDCKSETVAHFIGHCPGCSQIGAEYFHTYYTNADDIFNKQSLARIVGYALKTKRFLTPEEKYQSGVEYEVYVKSEHSWTLKRYLSHTSALYARYLCSRDALGLKAEAGRPSAARDDRVSCIQTSAFFTPILPTPHQFYSPNY